MLTSVLTVGLVAELKNSPQFDADQAKVVIGAARELTVAELPVPFVAMTVVGVLRVGYQSATSMNVLFAVGGMPSGIAVFAWAGEPRMSSVPRTKLAPRLMAIGVV